MKFEQYNLAPEIKRNIADLGFVKPTDIQFKSIPPILKGEDVLAIAQTGTGKTAAFAIPVIDILHNRNFVERVKGIKCVVMVPTHELALQITDVFKRLASHTKVKILCVHGGTEQDPQIEKLQMGVDIIIATPGRMFDLIGQGYIDLHRVEILILDEADHMLDLGFIGDIDSIMKHIPGFHQTLFFSATINEKIKNLAYSIVHNPIRIQISPKDPVAKNITHSVAFMEMDHKRFFLERIVNENPESKILVFVRTKVRAERVCKAMERVGIICQTIHSDKEQKNRSKVMDLFRKGELKILIATDVSARGIDVPNVDYVINYDLPEVAENYVHRVGRTGRGTQKGIAISFCSEEENNILQEIENFLTKPINVMDISPSEYSTTLDFSAEPKSDWKTLIKEVENADMYKKKAKKKK